MAEPLRKRGRRLRGGSAGRGTRGSRGGRGRGPRVQRSPVGSSLDSVLVDLVSDSDEDVLEVPRERDAACPAEIPLPEPSAPAASHDDSDTDSDGADAGAAPRAPVRRRRRLLLNPGEAPVVPVYSGKVKNSLHLIPDHRSLLKLCPPDAEEEDTDMADSSVPHSEESSVPESHWKKKLQQEDEDEKEATFLIPETSPLTPLPRTKNRKHTQALQKLREVNRRLQDLRSCLSPQQRRDQDLLDQEDEVVLVEGPPLPENPRLFPLKVRCRADLIRLPVRMSEPLQSVVEHMAARLDVSPSRILLLFGEMELSPSSTPRTLKLGVADILDCVVLASPPETTDSAQLLRLRVQGKEKHQILDVSLASDSPLKTLMCRYEEAMGLSGHKLAFFFDGMKLSGKELPADLGMESGDLIEVWG